MFNPIEEAIHDLKQGKIIIVIDDEDRENEGDFVALADKVTPEMINFMITHGKGLVCTPISEELAYTLDLSLMTNKNTDPYSTAFTVSIDHIQTTTGISAEERALTIKALTERQVKKEDFKRPGHVFPLIAKKDGVLQRAGHTEAAIDLAKLSGAFPASIICEIIKEDGTMARLPELVKIAEKFEMKLITIKDLISYRKHHESLVKREVETTLSTEYGEFKMIGYSNKLDSKEHIALVKGEISKGQPVLVRIHSECLTGDVFHSTRCDCGPQLDQALKMISDKGHGILVYMRQEGRGIGLFNKLRAYQLQNEGLDTVEANEALGFPADMREYEISAQILLDLHANTIELITNNPKKVKALKDNQIHVIDRVETELAIHKENSKYLHTKQQKLGHLLSL
ncbi:bifunctional 3,4-dihydroxy-2-butanone-4-phosphate synthase/GTP cyclohydrolase II [Pseudogracilibacillus sp. SE30717A]|uniref:bifunctional 3,4-dihydroxy-2-butanone-4-phosphate synthase/GTP cyclohydrolase II n=1 Tax=Pseudogracilibacillus sp. SE30717A TaxID=3098293 RepID=UPI00300E1EF5